MLYYAQAYSDDLAGLARIMVVPRNSAEEGSVYLDFVGSVELAVKMAFALNLRA